MDLLDRARALAACPLFEPLAPALVIRLAALAHARELAAGEVCDSARDVWIVAAGDLAITGGEPSKVATAGSALGMIRVVSPTTPVVAATARAPAIVVGLAHDDVRDVLEEDPAAMSALAEAVARLLLREAA